MFYTLKTPLFVDYGEETIPTADMRTVEASEEYFSRMNNQELIEDAPIFDHFLLKMLYVDNPKIWEWILLDIFRFSGGDIPGGWLVSEHFKQVLEQFIIAPPHRFYPAKLQYKGNKLDYFIFNLLWTDFESTIPIDEMKFNLTDVDTEENKGPLQETFHTLAELKKRKSTLRMQDRLRMSFSAIRFNQYYDLIPLFGFSPDVIVSERLKKAIELSNIKGVTIEETPYEVIMPDHKINV